MSKPGDSLRDEPALAGSIAERGTDDGGPARAAPRPTMPETQAVWHEPAFADGVADRRQYAAFLAEQRRRTPPWQTAPVFAGVLLVSGPLAIASTVFARGAPSGSLGVLGICVATPVIEELGKVALPLMLVETRPWCFRNTGLILAACLVSALVFASIENLLYLRVYIPNPSDVLVAWRWSVCTAVHVCATALAAAGIMRMHRAVFTGSRPPEFKTAVPWLIAAMVLHGAYNFLALFASFIPGLDGN